MGDKKKTEKETKSEKTEELTPRKFKFGDTVRDIHNGQTGQVIGVTAHLTMCDRYIIQPPGMDEETGLPNHADAVDVTLLERVKEDPDFKFVPLPKQRVFLGDRVKDTITPYEGIVTGITEWSAGCRRIEVKSSTLSKKGKPVISVFDEIQLETVVKKDPPPVRPETGGPASVPQRR